MSLFRSKLRESLNDSNIASILKLWTSASSFATLSFSNYYPNSIPYDVLFTSQYLLRSLSLFLAVSRSSYQSVPKVHVSPPSDYHSHQPILFSPSSTNQLAFFESPLHQNHPASLDPVTIVYFAKKYFKTIALHFSSAPLLSFSNPTPNFNIISLI